MLIQITNSCTMGCPHCLQDSKVGDYHMTDETFNNALEFSNYMWTLIYNISGGEPTMHPKFYELISKLNEKMSKKPFHFPFIRPNMFFIESNGEFLKDDNLIDEVENITKMEYFAKLQICSINGLYSNYDFIMEKRPFIKKIFGDSVYIHSDGIAAMKDLGRAKENEGPLKEAEESKYFMSCLNSCLAAKQCEKPEQYTYALCKNGKSCVPMVDWRGNVHMSESITCPSVGNVNTDSFNEIYTCMRSFKPCGRCLGYKRLMASSDSKIVNAREILGLKS